MIDFFLCSVKKKAKEKTKTITFFFIVEKEEKKKKKLSLASPIASSVLFLVLFIAFLKSHEALPGLTRPEASGFVLVEDAFLCGGEHQRQQQFVDDRVSDVVVVDAVDVGSRQSSTLPLCFLAVPTTATTATAAACIFVLVCYYIVSCRIHARFQQQRKQWQ